MRTVHLFVAAIAACNAFSPQPTKHASITSALSLTRQNPGEKIIDGSHHPSCGATSRRGAVSIIATAAVSNLLLTSKKAQAVTQSQSSASAFLGTYSDPINHPGGKRTIQLLGSGDNNSSSIGDYTLAQVLGGGGVGEPKEYVLPAVILGDRAIVIDFSPKGGPRDFTGVLEKDGSIRFLRDGNRWPRI